MSDRFKEKDAKAKAYFAKTVEPAMREAAKTQGRPEDPDVVAEVVVQVMPPPDGEG